MEEYRMEKTVTRGELEPEDSRKSDTEQEKMFCKEEAVDVTLQPIYT